jgi:hypothetical protein
LKKIIVAIVAILAICVSLGLFFSIVDFSSGEIMTHGGDGFYIYNENPFFTTNETTVKISMGYVPSRGVVLYCAYLIIDSNLNAIDGSLMWRLPFFPEYHIEKTLTNLPNGKYTLVIASRYADGSIHTPENFTFTVDTAFIYPKLTVVSPQNQTYNVNHVDIICNVNLKLLMSYYQLDDQNWISFNGNSTLSGLSNGWHKLAISVATEANRQIAQANEAQTIYFNVSAP